MIIPRATVFWSSVSQDKLIIYMDELSRDASKLILHVNNN